MSLLMFACMRAELSKAGALILMRPFWLSGKASPFPFSSAVSLLAILSAVWGGLKGCRVGSVEVAV
ncbi:hypothetical protein DY000_02034594 [Brassica cretica]|uniref:Secreted protein n=1 Tax=Brassica cretica TaxID=69181 RepID=A0ABQ7DES3_BRACR|nr:hypothetical protein DY000_02034594 [Brassica cretica]